MADRGFAQRVVASGFLEAKELERETSWALGRYQVQGPLGRGATSEVLLAKDPLLGRQVAIKLLDPTVCKPARFEREMQVLAALKHSAIVEIYDAGVHGERPYFVMEYVGGRSLDGADLSLRERVVVLEQVARACAFAHGEGIVHRDLKPANILLGDSGAVVADFGLARLADDDAGLTQPGTLVGTLAYMAPEQTGMRKLPIGPWSDVYSLGAMLYEFLCGRLAHEASDLRVFLANRASDDVPERPTTIRPDASAELEAIAMRALEKAPKDRYASADGFADALRAWLGGSDTPRQRDSASATPALVAVLIGLPLVALVLAGVALLGSPKTVEGVVVSVEAPAPEEPKPEQPGPELEPESKPAPEPVSGPEPTVPEAQPAPDAGVQAAVRRALALAEHARSATAWLEVAEEFASVLSDACDAPPALEVMATAFRVLSAHVFSDRISPAEVARALTLAGTFEHALRPRGDKPSPLRVGTWCDVQILTGALTPGADFSGVTRIIDEVLANRAESACSAALIAMFRFKRSAPDFEPKWVDRARSHLERARSLKKKEIRVELKVLEQMLSAVERRTGRPR